MLLDLVIVNPKILETGGTESSMIVVVIGVLPFAFGIEAIFRHFSTVLGGFALMLFFVAFNLYSNTSRRIKRALNSACDDRAPQ